MSTKRTRRPVDLRPISSVCRRYSSAAHQIGHFHMSEGYEIVRLCTPDTVVVRWHPAYHGSSFGASVKDESMADAARILENIANDLVAAGFIVTTDDELNLRVRITD